MIKQHNQGNLLKKESIWAYDSRGLRVFSDQEAWKAWGQVQELESLLLEPQAQSRETKVERVSL